MNLTTNVFAIRNFDRWKLERRSRTDFGFFFQNRSIDLPYIWRGGQMVSVQYFAGTEFVSIMFVSDLYFVTKTIKLIHLQIIIDYHENAYEVFGDIVEKINAMLPSDLKKLSLHARLKYNWRKEGF